MINDSSDLIFRLALQPGTTKQVDGKTYVLNHNHRWTLPKDSPGQQTLFDDNPVAETKPESFDVEVEKAKEDYAKNGVKAKSFKQWFGDWEVGEGSKVVDGKGEPEKQLPIAVFHGTARGGFDQFDPKKDKGHNILGKGFYFTADEEIATEYTKKDTGARDEASGATGFHVRGTETPVKTFDSKVISFLLDNTTEELRSEEKGYIKGSLENPNWNWAQKIALDESNGDVAKFLEVYRSDLTGKKMTMNPRTKTLRLIEPDESDYQDTRFDRGPSDGGILDFYERYNLVAAHLGADQIWPTVPPPELFKVYLNIRNPLDMQSIPSQEEAMEFIHALGDGKAHLYMDNILNYSDWENRIKIDYAIPAKKLTYKHLQRIKNIMKQMKHKETSTGWNGRVYKEGSPVYPVMHLTSETPLSWGEIQYIVTNGQNTNDAATFNEQVRKRGHDGIKDVGGYNIGTKNHDVWVAFNSEQIKSVDNQGTFDKSKPNIRMALQPGTTKNVNGKTYVLNENHRWTRQKPNNAGQNVSTTKTTDDTATQNPTAARPFAPLDTEEMQRAGFNNTPPPFEKTLLSRDARRWYLYQETLIHDNIDPNLSREERARAAFQMRNKVRQKARQLMHDIETAEYLNQNEKNMSFEDLIERKKAKYGIEDPQQLYDAIYESANKSRASVNASFNL